MSRAGDNVRADDVRAGIVERGSARGAGAVAVEAVTDLERFRELAPAWRELLEASPRPSMFQAHSWLVARWRTGAGRPLVLTAVRDGRLVAALPLVVHGRRAGLLDEGSDMDALLRTDEPVETVRELVEEARSRFGYLRCFAIRQGVLAAALDEPLLAAGQLNLLDMPDGWEAAYAERFSSKHRQDHRRRLRRLGEHGEVETELARAPESIAAALDDVVRLHALRWHGRHDGAQLDSEQSRAFHRALVEELTPADGHAIALTRCGGKAVAFSWYAVIGDVMTGYRIGFDPEYGRYSVGLTNLLGALQSGSDDGARLANFLRGGEEYKNQLCNRREALVGGTVLASGLAGRAEALAHEARHRAWLALREVEPLKRGYHRALAWRNLRRAGEPGAAPRPSE